MVGRPRGAPRCHQRPGRDPGRLASTTDFPSIVARRTPKTDLFLAIEAGDAQAVASILASDPASLQRARPDGKTPLRRAVDLRHTRIIDLLHQRGVVWDPMSAVIGRRAVVLQDLLTRSPGSITNAERGRGLLQVAAEHADVPILEQLLAAGADPKALDPWGLSPLGIALVTGRRDIEAHLRAKGLRESVFDAVHGGRGGALAERLRLDPESARTPNGFGVSAAAVAAGLDRPELLEAFFAAGVAPTSPNRLQDDPCCTSPQSATPRMPCVGCSRPGPGPRSSMRAASRRCTMQPLQVPVTL